MRCFFRKWNCFSAQLLRRQQKRQGFGEIQRHTAVAIADLFYADPDDLAGGHQRIEICVMIVARCALARISRSSSDASIAAPLQIFDGVEQRIEPAPSHADALPARREPRKGALLDWLDFAAQTRQGFAADLLQHFGIAPFAMRAAGAELAFEQFAKSMQGAQSRFDRGSRQAVARRNFGGGERPVRARVAAQNFASGSSLLARNTSASPGGSGMPRASR